MIASCVFLDLEDSGLPRKKRNYENALQRGCN